MSNPTFTDITIPAGTPFSKCAQPRSGEWNDCTDLEKIQNEDGYVGEFQKALQGENVAEFASPSFGSCIPLSSESVDTCNIELKFKQAQVEWLEKRIPLIAATPPPLIIASEDYASNAEPAEPTTFQIIGANFLPLFGSLILLFLLFKHKDRVLRLIIGNNRTRRPTPWNHNTYLNIKPSESKVQKVKFPEQTGTEQILKRWEESEKSLASEESMQRAVDELNSRLDDLNSESQEKLTNADQDHIPEIEKNLMEIQHLFDKKLISESEYQALRKKSLGL